LFAIIQLMKKIILLLSVFFYSIENIEAQSGVLDPSFGVKGIVKTDFGFLYDYNYATSGKQILLQADGSMLLIVEAGFSANRQSYVAKRHSDGSPDISYGNNGFSDPVHIVDAHAAQQADGKIVITGVHSGVYTVARINTNGTLDNSFDTDGMQTVGFAPDAIAVQADGKIVVAGSISNGSDNGFILARYNSNGSVDNTFDGDGSQTTDFGGDDFAASIALQSDSKIVVTGQTFNAGPDFATARYNTNGSLDNTFSGDGKQITDVSTSDDIAKAAAIQSDGKIVIAGYSWNGSTNQFSLVRYNSDGTPDNTFDGDGKQVANLGSEYIAWSLALQSDGKLLVAGYAFPGGGADFAVARFNTNGSVDNSFGNSGKQITDFDGEDHANSIAVKSDGKIIVVGEQNDGSDFAIAQYTSGGILDNTFDENGKLTGKLQLNQGSTFYTSIAIQTDGRLVAAGYTWNGDNYDFAVARYNSNGSLDNTFSGDGKLMTDYNGGDDFAYSLAIQSDGKIVVVGESNSNFALVRYNTDGVIDNTFSGGKFTTDLGFDDNAQAVKIQTDGKIVVAGWSINGFDIDSQQPTADFAICRYNTNGSLDNSFSGDGKVTTNFGFDDRAKSIALQGDGKIVVAGSKQVHDPGGDDSQFAVARYTADGELDLDFSDDGKKLTTINTNAYANSVAIQSDGKILVGGSTGFQSSTLSNFALVRYNANGLIDDSFDEDGIQTTHLGSVYKSSNSLAIQDDGKIVLTGAAGGNFTLVRYNDAGSLDDTFSEGGVLVTAVSAADDRIEGAVISGDDLYVAGYGQFPGNLGVVAKYLLASGGPTPVTLVDFSAVLKNNAVVLQWQVANQQNLSGYVIERSTDSRNFYFIGQEVARNGSFNNNYSIIDQQPLQGTNFYRLKMIDVDGKFVYSKIVAVKLEGNSIVLQLFPNPASNILFVQLKGENEIAAVQIIDANGRKIKEKKFTLNGNMSLSFDISELPAGPYSLLLYKKENLFIKKFVKE
jgi:uncharacterized delta-60 repeat protein